MSGMWPQGIRPSVAEMPSFLNSRSTLEYEPYSTAKNAPMGMTQYKDHVEQLMRFFGQPKKPILIDPEDSYDKEHLDLPDAYEGKNLRMRNILIDMIQESELYPIRVLFPLQRNEDSMTIQWDTWNFNMHQLNRQPEESTPRLLSFNKSSAQESFVRYGIGLMLEHGFYKTPMGRETYMMHLVQIRNATVETMAFGAMVAAVNHAKYKDPNDLYRQTAARDKSMLERLLSEERNRWAQAQKTPYGLRLAESALSRIMISRNGMDADSVVIPDRMFDNAGLQDEHRLYYLSGKAGGAPSDAQIEAKSFKGKRHFRSRGFRMADHRPAEDPCYQDQTIGGYFHMVGAHLVDVPPEDYRTSMMDTFIFSRAKDNYVRLYFRDMIRYSGLYHWDDGDGGDMHWTSNVGQKFFTRSSGADAARGIITRVSTHGEYAAKVKVLDRQIRSIHAWGLDPSKQHLQREFVRQFAPEFDAPPDRAAAADAESAADFSAGRMSAFPSFSRLDTSGARVLSDEVKSGNNSAEKLKKFLQLLETTESDLGNRTAFTHRQRYVLDKNHYMHHTVAEHARAACDDLRESEKPVIFSVVFERVLPGIFELQIDHALTDIVGSKTELTPLEHAFKKGVRNGPALNEADEDSPALLFPGESTRAFHVLLSADASLDPSQRYLKLEYNSFTLTLASSAIVLYAMESFDVDAARANNGLARYAVGKRGAYNMNKLSDKRWIFSQVSLSVSLVYRAFEDMANGDAYNAAAALALLKTIVPAVRSHVKNVPHDTFFSYVQDVSPLRDFALLNVRLFSPMIKCFEIAKLIMKGETPTEARLDAAFKDVKKYRLGSPYDSVALVDDPLDKVDETTRRAGVAGDVDFFSTERLLRAHYKSAKPEIRAREQKEVDSLLNDLILQQIINKFPDKSPEKKAAKTFVTERMEEIKALYHLWNVEMKNGDKVDTKEECWKFLSAIFIALCDIDSKNGPQKYRKINMVLDFLYAGPLKVADSALLDPVDDLVKKIEKKENWDGEMKVVTNAIDEFTTNFFAAPKRGQNDKYSLYSFPSPHGWYEYFDDAILKTSSDKEKLMMQILLTLAFRFREYCNSLEENSGGDNIWTKISNASTAEEAVTLGSSLFWDESFQKPRIFSILKSKLKDDEYKNSFYPIYVAGMYQSGKKPLESRKYSTEYTKSVYPSLIERSKSAIASFSADSEVEEKNFRSSFALGADPLSSSGSALAAKSGPSRSSWKPLSQSDIKSILYSIPIHSGRYLKFCLDHNVPPHIGVLGFRPHKSFRMGTLIYMNRAKAGSTWWGHADFMLADDAARKMHYGNFTIYAKTVITNNKFICLFQNIFCSEYLGGDAHEIFDASDPDQVEDYMAGENMRDIFICAVPIHFDTTRTSFMDITGRFVDSLCCDANTQSLAWYDSADVYRALWGWRHSAQPNSDNLMGKQPKANTMVFQEQQFLFNPTSGRFDYKIDDAGHWGDENIYPGCTRVIQGHEGMFRSAAAVYNRSGAGVGPNDIFGPPGTRPMSA